MRRVCLLILLLIAAPLRSVAAESPVAVYSLEDCLNIGLERSAAILNARRDEAIADAKVGQVRAQLIPQAGATARYYRQGDVPKTGEGDPFGRRDNYSAGVEATQLLYAGGRISTALRAARLYQGAASAATRAATARLVRDIHRGFHDVRLAAQSSLVATQSVEQLRLLVAQSERKHGQGVLSDFELLSAKVRLANELPTWIDARNRLELSKAAFATLLHLDSAAFDLSGDPPAGPGPRSLEELTAIALRQRPELAEAAQRVDLSEAVIEIEQGGWKPTLNAYAAYAGNNPDMADPANDAWNWAWQAGLQMTWKPFDGGLRRATAREKTLEWQKAKTDFSELQNAIRLDVHQAWLEWHRAQEAFEGARDNVSLAEKAQDIAAVRQKQGLSTYLEFTESNLALSTARLNLIRARRDRAVAETEIRHACGLLTEPSTPAENP